MIFDDRTYSTLVISASSKFNDSISSILTECHCSPITYKDSIAAAKRATLECTYDFIIINSPLLDEQGTKFAIDISLNKSTICLILVKADLFSEIQSQVVSHGVFTLSKPIATSAFTQGLNFMAAARERLKTIEKKALSIEEKMEEIRLVNRAKWLLIDNLSMAETDAHRYIEKQAMDTCTSKRSIAESIIRMYA